MALLVLGARPRVVSVRNTNRLNHSRLIQTLDHEYHHASLDKNGSTTCHWSHGWIRTVNLAPGWPDNGRRVQQNRFDLRDHRRSNRTILFDPARFAYTIFAMRPCTTACNS